MTMQSSRKDAPSWGRLINTPRTVKKLQPDCLDAASTTMLAYGNGRSYGDTCHNDDGTLIDTKSSNAILAFDRDKGTLRAESGILLGDILNHIQSDGWLLPVVPGTKFVTLGGAIANDIHGKNHSHRGTFGRYVKHLDLLRSGNTLLRCSNRKNVDLFRATIGGMGLTGIITSAEIQLLKVPSHFVTETKTPFGSLSEFMALSADIESHSEYSVAWIDSLARGKKLGRGIFISGDHTNSDAIHVYGKPNLNVPLSPPFPLVSGPPLRAFNFAYFHRNAHQTAERLASPDSFFFPLDAVGNWNRLYGPRGLFQHQCVVPQEAALKTLTALLQVSQNAGHGSFLTVLKRFGDMPSPGLMSFPQPGYTLTLDFPNHGRKTRALMDHLDAITLQAGGRINPYKDGRMSAETYQRGFPQWEKLETLRDPALMSDFWKRVASRKHVFAPNIETDVSKASINQTPKREVQEK